MSEHAPKNHETKTPSHEHSTVHKSPERIAKSPETTTELTAEQAKDRLETIRHDVAEKAISKDEVIIDQSDKGESNTSQPLINRELKSVMLSRTLARVQKQLRPAERTFSKVIHAKPIDKMSNVSEKTVARPYGILGGAIVAFIGSLFSTYLSRQFGLEYNLVLFLMLFTAGYIVTTLLEGIARLVFRSK